MPKSIESQQFRSDYARVKNLLEQTKNQYEAHPLFEDAEHVLDYIEDADPVSGTLALHFLSVALSEVLSGRGEHARLCLLLSQALVESELADSLQSLFDLVFCYDPEETPESSTGSEATIAELVHEIAKNPKKFLAMAPGANTEVKLSGATAKLVKLGNITEAKKKKDKKSLNNGDDVNPLWN